MRAQTASYVISVKLKLSESIEHHLEKSFRIAASAYNEALSFGSRRFGALKQNAIYQKLIEERRFDDKRKECDQALFEFRKSYGLTEFGLSIHLGQQRKKSDSPYKQLNSGELQVIAGQAHKTLEKVLFYQVKSKHLRFRSKYDLKVSYRNRVNTTGTRLVPSDRKGIAYRLYLHKASTFVDIPVKAFNTYQQMSLLRSKKIKYVQIIRKTIRGKKVYILQIVCQGSPLSKVIRGEGILGIDPGISTVAYASNREVALVDLVPKDINHKERLMRHLDRKIERSRRANNPDCYGVDGTIKKGVRFKQPSNRQMRLRVRRLKAYCSLSEEDLNVKGLQKRSRDIRINPKTNKPFSKKRFGKSIFRAAPSAFRKTIQTKARQLGIDFEIISPRDTKPSQYNHLTQTFEKKALSTRIFDLSEDVTDVQRDIYAAFLIGHIENGHYKQEQLIQDFPVFYKRMKEFLHQPPKTSRLVWYLH